MAPFCTLCISSGLFLCFAFRTLVHLQSLVACLHDERLQVPMGLDHKVIDDILKAFDCHLFHKQ